MKKQLIALTFAVALCSQLYGMREDLRFSDVFRDYTNAINSLREHIRIFIQNNDDLPNNMIATPIVRISHKMLTIKNNDDYGKRIEHLTYIYSGAKLGNYNVSTFKQKADNAFNKICTIVKDKETISAKSKFTEHCERQLYNISAQDNDTNGVTYTFKVKIEPFDNINLEKNLPVIKDITDTLEDLE